ncbi:MAG: ATP-binding cassette domain-containing protein [Acidaminobacteraceae bacterium]
MIRLNDLSYSFPQKNLYTDISFELKDGHHCAFIGTSGSGKSTLINIIMNPDKYMYDGLLEIDPSCRIGYVSQFFEKDRTNSSTVFEYIASDFIKYQNKITDICTEMETSSDIGALLIKYQDTLDAFEAIGGDDYESIINKKLNLADLNKIRDFKVSELSGGEFKLIQVIREMLNSPEVIIMDEPDVFLDFENLNALKSLINSHKGILLVITHNRYLLNHCFNKIIHLENTDLQEFDGRYIDYNFSLLQSKIELQELAVADEKELARNDELIRKLRLIATYNTESSRGKSLNARVKLQERLEARKIKQPFVEIKKPNIKLHTPNVIEETIALDVKDYRLSFDDMLLENVNFQIKSTDKVAIIGSNGTGKTSLLRDIYNNASESIKINDDIQISYLSQVQGEIFDESNNLIEELYESGFDSLMKIKSHLQGYGFSGEILDQKIESLSGGEKNILQLAKVSSSNANMLLLDEPTSHLDTYSQIALEEAIENYNGSILMVSHDYYSIANCMDYVLILDNNTVRKMSMRKFRKTIYAKHFDKDYLEVERKKKIVETKIEQALTAINFERAKLLSEELEELIKLL